MAGTGLEDEDEVSDARRFGDEAGEEDEVAGEGDFNPNDVAGGFVMMLRREWHFFDVVPSEIFSWFCESLEKGLVKFSLVLQRFLGYTYFFSRKQHQQ